MKDYRNGMVLGFSIILLFIGILGLGNVKFFDSNVGLEIIETILGICGLLFVVRRRKEN